MQKKQLSVLVLIILCFLLGCNRETPKDESQQNYEDESNISKTNGEELVNINSELLGSTPFDIQIDKTALQTRKETETEVTIKTNLTDWGYTVSSEKGKISDINKNSFIYIAPKDERDDTIKIQLSDYENGSLFLVSLSNTELLEICQKWTQKKQQIFFGFTASCAAAVRRDGYSVEIKEDGGTLVYRLFTNY